MAPKIKSILDDEDGFDEEDFIFEEEIDADDDSLFIIDGDDEDFIDGDEELY